MPPQSIYPHINRTVYRTGRAAFRLLFNIATRHHVSGLEHVPPQGPFIAVTNHISHVDPPLLFIEMPFYSNVMVADKYKNHIFRPIIDLAGPIFINRGAVDRTSLNQSLAVLQDGGIIAIAIEGTRSRDGQLTPGKDGVAYLAKKANVPILPIALYGTENVFPAMLRLRRAHVYVAFGQPLHFPPGRVRSTELRQYTDQIMVAIAALLPAQYRGHYAHHPLLQQRLNGNTPSQSS